MKRYIPILENTNAPNSFWIEQDNKNGLDDLKNKVYEIIYDDNEVQVQNENIRKTYVEEIMRNSSFFETQPDVGRAFIPAVSVYVKDYSDDDGFIKFLNGYLNNDEPTSDRYEDLTDGGQQIYKILQTKGELIYYTQLGEHLEHKHQEEQDIESADMNPVDKFVENVDEDVDNAANIVNNDQKKQNKKYLDINLKKIK